MKVAICGSNPLACDIYDHLNSLGAAVSVYSCKGLRGQGEAFPIIAANSIQVQKRYLESNEIIFYQGRERDRFYDLFRVIFSRTPEQLDEAAKEKIAQMDQSLIDSLQGEIESFNDFDIVIITDENQLAVNTGRKFIGERYFSDSDKILRNQGALKKLESLDSDETLTNLVLTGELSKLREVVPKVRDWLFKKNENTLFLLSNNKDLDSSFGEDLKSALESDFKVKQDEFYKKLEQWKAEPDYIRAKLPRPQEPREKVFLFEGFSIMAVDRLIDNDQVFLSIEKPHFRTVDKEQDELKTIACDLVLQFRDEQEKIEIKEKGLYLLTNQKCERPSERREIVEHLHADLMKLFSKVEE